jgi:hypothetical protein
MGIGYGAWSTGNITDEMIENYLEHHKEGPNSDQNPNIHAITNLAEQIPTP